MASVSKRNIFAMAVAKLIIWCDGQGYSPRLVYAMRSVEEQQRLYSRGQSKCDGIKKISAHQYEQANGRFAVDIALIVDGKEASAEVYQKAHNYWMNSSGLNMLEDDQNHFEMDLRYFNPL
jgi:hypothetical protein